jgi:hypothetical protein
MSYRDTRMEDEEQIQDELNLHQYKAKGRSLTISIRFVALSRDNTSVTTWSDCTHMIAMQGNYEFGTKWVKLWKSHGSSD